MVKSIMNKNLRTVTNNLTVREVAKKLAEWKIGAVVIGSAETMEGMFSERDLLNKVVAAGLSVDETQVRDVMTKDLITIKDSAQVNEAMVIMEQKRIRHLPVVDDNGKCVGMLGARDVMHYHAQRLESENEALAQYLLADGPGG